MKARKPRNAEQTKERILTCATALFAKHGFEAAPLSDLIEAANVNQRMIYHYFGSKKGLYREVFKMQWMGLAAKIDELAESVNQENNPELLLSMLQALSQYFANHQEFVRLLLWEALEGGEISLSLWEEIRRPIFLKVQAVLKLAQVQGELPEKFDPAHLIITFLGATSFYYAYAHTLKDMVRRNPFSKNALQERHHQLGLTLEKLFRENPATNAL